MTIGAKLRERYGDYFLADPDEPVKIDATRLIAFGNVKNLDLFIEAEASHLCNNNTSRYCCDTILFLIVH
jgi:hypothetical protein